MKSTDSFRRATTLIGFEEGIMLLEILDLIGTFVFAVTGGLKAVKYELDFLGILVLSVITGLGGGIIRDIMLGQHPPIALQNDKYLLVTIVAGILVFFIARYFEKVLPLVRVLDALGLGVFTALGATTAINFGLSPIGVLIIAMLTATGGGVLRDLLVKEIPSVIRVDFYATASIVGASTRFLVDWLGGDIHYQVWVMIITTTAIRLLALYFNIKLPKALGWGR